MGKKEFRKISLDRLKNLSSQQRYIRDKQINSILYKMISSVGARVVMAYIPLDMEVDIMPLISRLRREGVVVLVPFMEGKSFRLVKYRMPLVKKQFGIREPKISKQFRKKYINIAIVPIVGTDNTCRRVGFGKGMYDRFFELEKKYIDKTIFTQRVFCFSDKILTDDFDVKADQIVAI